VGSAAGDGAVSGISAASAVTGGPSAESPSRRAITWGRSRATHLRRVPRGKDSVIAVAMDAWWRDEPRQAREQLEGREAEDGAPVGRGSR
jgi:hypothetical protein